ncbi:hypothetical protein EVAR_58895_1 [Eumeta japonica]|uniref:Uncharacterized protein n=1 Tax=Eumeta variegata TaxID=151549 RepID=A0A4C1Z216_EUMVA|nr:hypothetical protein EVAR_58895_1 [Eumeta japonica]
MLDSLHLRQQVCAAIFYCANRTSRAVATSGACTGSRADFNLASQLSIERGVGADCAPAQESGRHVNIVLISTPADSRLQL